MPDEISPASAYRDVMAIPARGIFRYRNQAGRMVSLKDDAADLAFRKHLQDTNGQGFDRAMINEWNQAKSDRMEAPRPGEADDRNAGKQALREKRMREQRHQQGMARRQQAQADPRRAAAMEQRRQQGTAAEATAGARGPGLGLQGQGAGVMAGAGVQAQMGSQVNARAPQGQMPGAQGRQRAMVDGVTREPGQAQGQNAANDMKNAQATGYQTGDGRKVAGANAMGQGQRLQRGPIQIPGSSGAASAVPLSPQQISEQFQLQPQQAQQLRDQLANESTPDEVLKRTYGLSTEEIGRLRGGLG